MPRSVTFQEPGGQFSVLVLPDDPVDAMVQAAAGVVAAAPETDGRARVLELLLSGGEPAARTASWVLGQALAGRPKL